MPTVAHELRDRGYTTYLSGKFHVGHARPAFLPSGRGFDHWFGFLNGAQGHFSRHFYSPEVCDSLAPVLVA